MTTSNRKTGAVAITALMVSCLMAQATVTIKNQWLLGEDGALVAKVGATALTRTGTTTDGAGVATGSTVSQSFTNPINGSDGNPTAGNYMTAAITLANTSNWGISAWIKPSVLSNGSPQGECGFFKIGVLEIDYNSGKWMVIQQGSALTLVSTGSLPAPAINTPFQVS